MPKHRRIYGVDFSGAKNAGKKIWIALGLIDGQKMRIAECQSAADLFHSEDRDDCLKELRELVRRKGDCIFGFDFPFGLSCALVDESTWTDFARSFPIRYPNVQEFRRKCHSLSPGRELKRLTDAVNATPWAPCNLRLYRQTYYGIRDLLAPLIEEDEVSVLPMQKHIPGKAWLIEVCPASTLKRKELDKGYKGNKPDCLAKRELILRWVTESGGLSIPGEIQSKVLAHNDGDALDSVIAAFAAYRASLNEFSTPDQGKRAYAIEGYVYI